MTQGLDVLRPRTSLRPNLWVNQARYRPKTARQPKSSMEPAFVRGIERAAFGVSGRSKRATDPRPLDKPATPLDGLAAILPPAVGESN